VIKLGIGRKGRNDGGTKNFKCLISSHEMSDVLRELIWPWCEGDVLGTPAKKEENGQLYQ
jgi:hypothetical protein